MQTHIHHDHMVAFNTSKANQVILSSQETRDLLIAVHNADLPFRNNLVGLAFDEPYAVDGETIELVRSCHMLGGAQVAVTCGDGYKVGYSSDFYWPLERVIRVDELLVDATYGCPNTRRTYEQIHVDEKLIEAVVTRLRAGRQIAIIGVNGRLQYALSLLGQVITVPFICSQHAFPLIDVYRRYGYEMPSALRSSDEEAIKLIRERVPCITYVTFQDRRHLPWIDRLSKISLSAYMTGRHDPVLDYGNGDCRIAFTDHADFDSTLAYVEASGARMVWTDPRSGDAEGLAGAITSLLGVESRVPERIESLSWG